MTIQQSPQKSEQPPCFGWAAFDVVKQKMKPSLFQYFFAEDWLGKIWVGTFVLGFTGVMIYYSLPLFSLLGISLSSALLVAVIFIISIIAYLASFIAGCFILPPFYRLRERLNGAPFAEGDLVEILKKPYRGRKATVTCEGNPQYGLFVRFLDDSPDTHNFMLSEMRRAPKVKQTEK